jgi:DNA primase
MSTPGDFAQTVKQQADIVRVIGEYVTLKKSGAQNFSGLCPFHKEKSPSFSVHATKQFYHCFGCGKSGDVFKFVQEIDGVTFPEAVRTVAQKAGIPLPKQTYNTAQEAADAKLRAQLLDLNERASAFFQEMLRKPEGANAREYLASRGMDEKAIAEFKVGFAPESGFLLRDRLKSAAEEKVLRDSGLFSWKDDAKAAGGEQVLYSKFRNRVMFPIANENGKIIAFTGRTLAADEKAGPKYLNSPETAIYSKSRVLFNLDKAKEAIRQLGYSVLVEGQMDCISVYLAGFKNVIASSGTAFTEPQVRLLARYAKNIVVNFDPDTAGAAAAERSLALLVEEDFNIKVVTLEPGFDPDLFIRRQGRDAYAGVLRAAQPYFDYLIDRAQKQFNTRTPAGKVQAVNFLLPHIQRVPNRIVRDELSLNIAQKLAIDSQVLRQELRQVATQRSGQVKSPSGEAQTSSSEKVLLRALSEPSTSELHQRAAEVLASERLHEGLGTEPLLESLRAGQHSDAIDAASNDADRRLLAGVLMDESEELTDALLEQAFSALRHQRTEREMRALKAEIAEAERKNDAASLARLMQKKMELDRALTRR